MNIFNEVKEKLDLDVKDDLLVALIFETSRFYDNKLPAIYKNIQKKENIILSSAERKNIRKKCYYGNYYNNNDTTYIQQFTYDKNDIETVFADCLERLSKYDNAKIVNSMKQRLNNLNHNDTIHSTTSEWLKYYDKKREDKKYSLCCFPLDQQKFKENHYNENIITDFIKKTYNYLENYRYLAIVINGEISNEQGDVITWNLLYKAGIYAENFVQFYDAFFPFKKSKQINVLASFLSHKGISDFDELSNDFYSSISTGYRFEDCYISNDQKCKILILKKIELDESPVPCPSCNTTLQRGNSYPELFLRSYECTNPNCPDRSKSGRGKRFDEYGTYRYFKSVLNEDENRIDNATYNNWRRDIFDSSLNWRELLLTEYSFSGESVFIYGDSLNIIKGRKIINIDYESFDVKDNMVSSYEELPIVRLFKEINQRLIINTGEKTFICDQEILNGDSSKILQEFKHGLIGTAITSPPYYNAREYSQWPNMILYLIDMMINCKSIYASLKKGGYYLYNIGDIVAEDNIYVNSNMSKHRVQLGFLSCMIFEIVGYNLVGNNIWDKGEVQSKRNSTVNLISGYVKCINCYEHVLVFRKGKYEKLSNCVKKITPVIKINSKGINTYKHTAPYPLELVNFIIPYLDKSAYVLDPYLGSGTTILWCKENNVKGVGIELNNEYYKLCVKKINKKENQQLSLF